MEFPSVAQSFKNSWLRQLMHTFFMLNSVSPYWSLLCLHNTQSGLEVFRWVDSDVVNKMRQQNVLCTEDWENTCAWQRGAQVLKEFLGMGRGMGQNEETGVV